MIDKEDIINNEDIISQKEAYNSQVKLYEDILFKFFLRSDEGKIFKRLHYNIKSKYDIQKTQRAVVNISKLENIISSYEKNIDSKRVCFVYSFKFYNNNILILNSANKDVFKSRYYINKIDHKSDIYRVDPYNKPFKRLSKIINLHY